MITQKEGKGEKAGMKEERADLEMLLLLAASEVARKRHKAEHKAASRVREGAEGAYRF